MAIDPSIYRGVDTQFGQKLADLLNPASIRQRQMAEEEQNMGNQLRQMQVIQGVQQMQRAPVLAQRENQQWQAQQAEAQRLQQERAEKEAMFAQATPEQQKMLRLGVPAKDVFIPKVEKPIQIIQEMRAAGISETSPEGQRILRQRLTKETTHAPAAKMQTIVNPAIDPFKNEKSLREEYQGLPQVKSAAEMNTAFKMIETAYQRPSAANDLAMATKFMKILDPTSVVRESEFAMAVNATGLMDKVYNYANMIKTGQRLNPTQRKDFYDSSKAINDAFQGEAQHVGQRYQGIAGQYGLDPDNITFGTDFEKRKPSPVPSAQPGNLSPSEQQELNQLRARFKGR